MTRKQAAALLASARGHSHADLRMYLQGLTHRRRQFSEVSFSYADLGLVEPSVAKLATHPDVRVAAQYEDAAPDAPVREFRTRPAPEATNPNLGYIQTTTYLCRGIPQRLSDRYRREHYPRR